jgi:hypothetical protein
MLKSKYPERDPCGIPKEISKGNEKMSKLGTENCRLVRTLRSWALYRELSTDVERR